MATAGDGVWMMVSVNVLVLPGLTPLPVVW
jgi:hypothetical protein